MGEKCGRGLVMVFATCAFSSPLFCQPAVSTDGATNASDQPAASNDGRVFGIIPNYRTFATLTNYKPIPPKQKFKIAAQDSFDRGTVVLAAAFAGEGQLTNSEPSFGQGARGYGQYFATAYGDLLIGDFMTEAIYPTLLHQDPRYFRRGTGSGWSRLGYAAGQIFWTHTDSGGTQFNASEIAGNSTAVAISTAYYPGGRDVSSAVSKLGVQLGVDMAANILKEFWPDLRHKFSREHKARQAGSTAAYVPQSRTASSPVQ